MNTKTTITCPVCLVELKLRPTKKPKTLYTFCNICWFRGFFPEDESLYKEPKPQIIKVPLKEFRLGNCSICGELLYWNLGRKQDRELLTRAINEAKFYHTNCAE